MHRTSCRGTNGSNTHSVTILSNDSKLPVMRKVFEGQPGQGATIFEIPGKSIGVWGSAQGPILPRARCTAVSNFEDMAMLIARANAITGQGLVCNVFMARPCSLGTSATEVVNYLMLFQHPHLVNLVSRQGHYLYKQVIKLRANTLINGLISHLTLVPQVANHMLQYGSRAC